MTDLAGVSLADEALVEAKLGASVFLLLFFMK
jgi:hypothetical protein